MNGAGGAIGVLLSGMITQWTSWRWILLINVPIGIVTAIAAIRIVSERRSGKRESFDVLGAAVLTLGQVLIAYGCVNAGTDGWGTTAAWIPIIIGAALLALFPVVESRAKSPADTAQVAHQHLKLVNLIVLLFSAALFPMWYMGSLYMQQVLSLQPITTGIAFLPMALMIMFCASRAGKLVSRFGVKPVLAGGLTFMTCGMALFARSQPSGSAIQYIILPGLLMTTGIGFSIVPSTIAAIQNASPDRAGLASGLVNTSRQIGGSLGLAVLISIATLHTSNLISSQRRGRAGADRRLPPRLPGRRRLLRGRAAADARLPRRSGAGAPLGAGPAAAPGPTGNPRSVAGAVGVVVAVFAVLAFGLPRTHGAADRRVHDQGHAQLRLGAPDLHPPKITGGPTSVGEQASRRHHDRQLLRPHPAADGRPERPADPRRQPAADLVQAGADRTSSPRTCWPRPTTGKPVLSWWQGDVTATGQINSGEDIVVNQHYQKIATLKGEDGWIPTLHEFVIRGHDAWVTANKNVPAQLAKYGGVNGGAMIDSAVQEYDLRTGKLVYSWVASKHISENDSYAVPPENGFPWDVYHVNSVDPLSNGTFLVSMRNTWAVYLVNEKTGKIEWTLGGKHSSFKLPKADRFQWQHDAQMLNPTTLSVFDDHCCISPAPASTSTRPAPRADWCSS